MRKKLLGIVLLTVMLSSCTSRDEAPIVQEAIVREMDADTDAFSASVAIDQQGTAIAQEHQLAAQGTQVAVAAQLTATAAPNIAAAGAARRENKTNAMNSMTYALMWTVIISIPLTGLGIAAAVWRASKRLGVVTVKSGELAVVGRWVLDGDSGSVRPLGQAQAQLPAKAAIRITHAAVPALKQGMNGDWIEGVIAQIEDDHAEEQQAEFATPVDRQLGEHAG